jgi:hypothetical protein
MSSDRAGRLGGFSGRRSQKINSLTKSLDDRVGSSTTEDFRISGFCHGISRIIDAKKPPDLRKTKSARARSIGRRRDLRRFSLGEFW